MDMGKTDGTLGKTHVIIRLLCIAVAVLACVFLFYFLWKRGAFLPSWVKWNEKAENHVFTDIPGEYEDPDREAVVETAGIQLKRRHLSVCDESGKLRWESNEGWRVSDYLIDDIDHDGEDEIVVLFWRIGSFGDSKPLWIEKDEKKWSQHIGIYDYDALRDDRVDPIWISSKMGIKAKDIWLDEKEFLHITEPGGKKTMWFWNNWGLFMSEPR
jgi:hypothetical protein